MFTLLARFCEASPLLPQRRATSRMATVRLVGLGMGSGSRQPVCTQRICLGYGRDRVARNLCQPMEVQPETTILMQLGRDRGAEDDWTGGTGGTLWPEGHGALLRFPRIPRHVTCDKTLGGVQMCIGAEECGWPFALCHFVLVKEKDFVRSQSHRWGPDPNTCPNAIAL